MVFLFSFKHIVRKIIYSSSFMIMKDNTILHISTVMIKLMNYKPIPRLTVFSLSPFAITVAIL